MCSKCGKAFARKDNLKDHELTHSEERKHKCPICEKSFKQAQVLTNHMKRHKN